MFTPGFIEVDRYAWLPLIAYLQFYLRQRRERPLPCRAQITADHCMHIRCCARLFDKFGLARAPVLEGGKIVGIVSYTDRVMKWLGGACC